MKKMTEYARHCECERRVEPLFVQQIADEMLLEHEQRAHFDQTSKNLVFEVHQTSLGVLFSKFAVEALRE